MHLLSTNLSQKMVCGLLFHSHSKKEELRKIVTLSYDHSVGESAQGVIQTSVSRIPLCSRVSKKFKLTCKLLFI